MPKAYWIAHVTVTDPAKYADYQALAPEAFQQHGARFLARGGDFKSLEGPQYQRHVVIEFDSLEQAQACYASDAYQAAKIHRDGACDVQVVLVEGAE